MGDDPGLVETLGAIRAGAATLNAEMKRVDRAFAAVETFLVRLSFGIRTEVRLGEKCAGYGEMRLAFGRVRGDLRLHFVIGTDAGETVAVPWAEAETEVRILAAGALPGLLTAVGEAADRAEALADRAAVISRAVRAALPEKRPNTRARGTDDG